MACITPVTGCERGCAKDSAITRENPYSGGEAWVDTARTTNRKPDEERWDIQGKEQIQGVLWKPDLGGEEGYEAAVRHQ